MRVLRREINDPLKILTETGKTGGGIVIEVANIQSWCFIETKDLGRFINKQEFEVLGRFDNSEIRGCNLMI
jgi:hypothetical protein